MSFEDYVDEDLYQPSEAELGNRPIIHSVNRDEKEFLTNLMAGALMAGHKEAKSIPGIRPTKEVTVSDDEIIQQADVWLRQIGLTYDGLTSLMTQADAQEGHDWAWELTRKPEAQWTAANILKTANPFNTAMDVITGKPGATQQSIREHGGNPYSNNTDYMGSAFAGLDALDIASLWPMYKGPMWVMKNLMARMAPGRTVAGMSNDLSPLLTAKDLRPEGIHSGIGPELTLISNNTFPPYDRTFHRHPQQIEAEISQLSSSEREHYLNMMHEREYNDYMAWQEGKFEDRWDWRQGPESVDEERAVSDLGDELYEQFNPANQFPNPNRITDQRKDAISADPYAMERSRQDNPWINFMDEGAESPIWSKGDVRGYTPTGEYVNGVGFITRDQYGNVGPPYPWTRPLPEQIDVGNLQATVFDVLDEFNVQYNQGALGQVIEEGGVEGLVESLLKQPHIEMMFPGKLRDILKLSDKEYSPFIKWLTAASLVAAPLGIKDMASQQRGPFGDNQEDKSGTVFEGINEAPMLETMMYDAAQQGKRMNVVMGRTSLEMLQPVWDGLVSNYGEAYAAELMDPPNETNPFITGNAVHLAYLDDAAQEWVGRNGPKYGFYQNPDRPWELTFGQKARPQTGGFGDVLSMAMNMENPLAPYFNPEPSVFADSFEVVQNREQLSSSERAIWANQFLQRIDAPVTASNLDTIITWIHNENGSSFNPINTTWGKSHTEWPVVNDHGVKAYPDWNTGLRASAATIQEGQYSEMLEALKRGTTPQEFSSLLVHSPWGTEHFHDAPDVLDYVELFNE